MPRSSHRDSFPKGPAPTPWTASRCSRLLRQLTSFVSRLEKWHKALLIAQEEDATCAVPPANADEPSEVASPTAWLTRGPSKKGSKEKKKYTARRRIAPRTPLAKGRRGFRSTDKTPRNNEILSILDTARTEDAYQERLKSSESVVGQPAAVQNSYAGHSSLNNPVLSRPWTARTVHLASDYGNIMRDGWTIIPTFLMATVDPGSRTHLSEAGPMEGEYPERGAKSLLHMCLAKLSQSLVEEQEQLDAKKDGHDGQTNIIGSQLQELEDYFGDSQTGWPPLRNVTRACGVSLVTQLIRKGAIPEDTAIELALRWPGQPAFGDFRDAIEDALVERGLHAVETHPRFHSLPDMDQLISAPDEQAHLRMLWQNHLSVSYALRFLRLRNDGPTLISSVLRWRHLSTAIMACRFTGSSQPTRASELLESVYCGALSSHQLEDWDYLRTLKLHAQDKASKRLSRMKGANLDAPTWNRLKMALYLMISCAFGADSGNLPDLLERISKRSQILLDLDRSSALSQEQRCLIAQTFFANLCQRIMNGRDAHGGLLLESFEVLLDSLDSWLIVSRHLVGAILSMALGWRSFQHLIEQLLSIANGGDGRLHLLLGQVCAGSAMDYAAERQDNPDVPLWASKVLESSQARMRITAVGIDTPAARDTCMAYRWDETMEEWVAKTPATLMVIGSQRPGTAIGEASRPTEKVTKSNGQQEHQPCRRHHRTSPGRQVPTTDATPSKSTNHFLGPPKRKRGPEDFEVYTDGDFEYKKSRRKMLPHERRWTMAEPKCAMASSRAHRPETRTGEDCCESEDELSLLE